MSADGVRHEEGAESEACKEREDGTHCVCWWDGEKCCACNAAGMTEDEKRSGGMPAEDEPGPVDSAAGFPVEGTTAPVDAFAIAAACTDETCGGECMAPAASPLEAAWAEVARLRAIWDSKQGEMLRASQAADEAWDPLWEAVQKAAKLGPRPARVPS